MRVLALAAALVLIALVAPAEVSPVGEAAAQCYQIGEESACINPCTAVARAVYKATGRTLYCTE